MRSKQPVTIYSTGHKLAATGIFSREKVNEKRYIHVVYKPKKTLQKMRNPREEANYQQKSKPMCLIGPLQCQKGTNQSNF